MALLCPDPDLPTTAAPDDSCFITALRSSLATPHARPLRAGSAQTLRYRPRLQRLDTPSTTRDAKVRLGLPHPAQRTHLASLTVRLNGELQRRPSPRSLRTGSASLRRSLPLPLLPTTNTQPPVRLLWEEVQRGIDEVRELHACQEKPLADPAAEVQKAPSPTKGARKKQKKRELQPSTPRRDESESEEPSPAVSPTSPYRRRDMIDRNIAEGATLWLKSRQPSTLRRAGRARDSRIHTTIERRNEDEREWVNGLEHKHALRSRRVERDRAAALQLRKHKRAMGLTLTCVAGAHVACWVKALCGARATRLLAEQRGNAHRVLDQLLSPRVKAWKAARIARELTLNVVLTIRRGMMRNAMRRRGRSATIIQSSLFLLKYQMRFKLLIQKLRSQILRIQHWWKSHRALWHAQMRAMQIQWNTEERLQERKHARSQVDATRTLCLIKELALVVAAVRERQATLCKSDRQLLVSERLCSRDKMREHAQRLTLEDLKHVAGARGLDPKGMRAVLDLLADPKQNDCYTELLSLRINELSDDDLTAAAVRVGAWHAFVRPSPAHRAAEMTRSLQVHREAHREALEEWRATHRGWQERRRSKQSSPRRREHPPQRPALRIVLRPHQRSAMFLRALAATLRGMGDPDSADAVAEQAAKAAATRTPSPPPANSQQESNPLLRLLGKRARQSIAEKKKSMRRPTTR